MKQARQTERHTLVFGRPKCGMSQANKSRNQLELRIPAFLALLCFLPVLWADGPADKAPLDTDRAGTDIATSGSAEPEISPSILPSPPAVSPALILPEYPEPGINWKGLFLQSSLFLGVEHGFRLGLQSDTRVGLRGPFFGNYFRSLGSLHGWADGNNFEVNYVGHPIQGAIAGYIWVQNDRPIYRYAEFGKDRTYWASRLRAAAFAWAYSEEFEIGPISEASIGSVQKSAPQFGFVDHVITPTIGLGWMIAEDALDKYFVKPLEGRTRNIWLRLLLRSTLNPGRSFANTLRGQLPWHRDTRLGIHAYSANDMMALIGPYARGPARDIPDVAGPAPFEFNVAFRPERLYGEGASTLCFGGGAEAAFRLAPSWQLVGTVGGCKMVGLEDDLSGDSLTYMIGPRWGIRSNSPWGAHLELLVGGTKLTQERTITDDKPLLAQTAVRNGAESALNEAALHAETSGFAIAVGGGVDYKLNRALAIRVADLTYHRAWIDPLFGRAYSNGLTLNSGLVVRFGTW